MPAAATPAPAPSARRNSRRPTAGLSDVFIVVSSKFSSIRAAAHTAHLRGQCKSLGLDVKKHAAKRSDLPIKIGSFCPLQISKETPDPRREVFLKYLLVGAGFRAEASGGKEIGR